jgi:hypothetical protein
MTNAAHDASSSALGYLYQCRWPLIELVARSRTQPDCEVLLELLDDVSFEDNGSPTELVQTKHRVQRRATLSDSSPDIWRTIGSWVDAQDPTDPLGPLLTLVTTDVAAEGSAAYGLRPDRRGSSVALGLLEDAARQSTSRETESSRARFLDLDPAARAVFVGRMRVLDGAPGISELRGLLREELHLVLPVGHEDAFIDLLVAWWDRQAVRLLKKEQRTVAALDLRRAADEIRDQFTANNLPTLVDAWAFDTSTYDTYSHHTFVQQLGWINVSTALLQHAIHNYFRAVTQSALWVEEHLVTTDEVERFEAELKHEWEHIFAHLTMTLPDDADEETKISVGRQVLQRAEDLATVRIRDRYSESFYFRGKLHQLSDDRAIGWHPDHPALLEEMLLTARE